MALLYENNTLVNTAAITNNQATFTEAGEAFVDCPANNIGGGSSEGPFPCGGASSCNGTLKTSAGCKSPTQVRVTNNVASEFQCGVTPFGPGKKTTIILSGTLTRTQGQNTDPTPVSAFYRVTFDGHYKCLAGL
jgi:hypothetical protein